MTKQAITPRLIVRSGAEAIAFYERAFGAEVLERYDAPDGSVVHSALSIHGAIVGVTDAAEAHGNFSPDGQEGPSVLLQLEVDDPDGVAAQMAEHGAEIVFPIETRFYGHRDGRVRDPFGHLWILLKVVEELGPEEIQRRVDDFPMD